jgi:hypothetical protein
MEMNILESHKKQLNCQLLKNNSLFMSVLLLAVACTAVTVQPEVLDLSISTLLSQVKTCDNDKN